ncbi:hypothetical protein HGRIS_005026 [Hohenbuehelia grisea]|uniref:PX domain-containing protein n=1 Tax=Hohenbuehelia grisea TaxID=104357 RepID=A0ABR3JEE1_9AGAR
MDGFDDLLGPPSRNVLEENPFEDPFSKRSGSPDPWATPFASSQHDDPYQSSYHAFEGSTATSASPTTQTTQESTMPSSTSHDSNAGNTAELNIKDTRPLDSATTQASDADPLASSRTDDDEVTLEPNRVSSTPRSPGFRESVVPVAFSETATIRPTEPENFAPALQPSSPSQPTHSPHIDREHGTPPASAAPQTPTTPGASSSIASFTPDVMHRSSSSITSTPGAEWGGAVVSPLQSSPASGFGGAGLGIERPFASLALGGESLGGWAESKPSPMSASAPSAAGNGAAQSDDDSDDDTPIGQKFANVHGENSLSAKAALQRKENGLQPIFVITVDDPQKVGDPIRGFTMYTVHTRTTSPMFQKSAFSVLRRYSDFLWLYETLSTNNPGVVVPPVPEKNPFGRFDDQFVRQRRTALEKCIQKIANHPQLGKDADLKLFLESDTFSLDIKHRKAEIAHERGGLMASIGHSIAGPRFYETDEWFDRQKSYLDTLESQLRGLVKAIEAVAKQRSELAGATGEFAHVVRELSASDVGKQLSQSLAGLADVDRTAQDLQSTQSEQDLTTLMATVDEYARLINSVRMAFSSRVRTYYSWKQSESDLLRTKQTHEKNRAQGRIPPDRLGFSLTQIAEAEKRATESKHEFEQVSKLVKTEVARFEQERVSDFKDSLHAFLEGMIARQKQLIAAWEDYQQILLKKVGAARVPASDGEAPATDS